MKPIRILYLSTISLTALGLIVACSSEPEGPPNNTSGGAATSGGATSGGATSGGAPATSGGAPATSGGAPATSGGAPATSGGATSGGAPASGGSGGAATGGSGGGAKGGSAGAASGGAAGAPAAGAGGAPAAGAGGAPAAGAGGAPAGGSGGGGTFSPVCGKTAAGVDIKKDVACTSADPQLCYRTCGVEAKGFKPETCTGGAYAEGSCAYPPGDFACYKIPAAAGAGCPADAATAPQHNAACTVAACVVCGGTSTGQTSGYKDSGGAAKVGYCVCTGGKWQCASDKEWPCPAGTGCQ